jgi:hypothetical protein
MSKNGKGNPEKSKPVWTVLANLSAAVGQVTNVTAILIPYLRNQEVMAKISDQPRFQRLAGTLDRDVRRMTQQYRDIQSQHSDRVGSTTNETEWMTAIDLSEQYRLWAQDFDDVVIPTFLDMVAMIQETGMDVSSIATPSAVLAANQSHH